MYRMFHLLPPALIQSSNRSFSCSFSQKEEKHKKAKENLFAGCAGHIYSSDYLLTVDGEHQQA